MRFITSAFKFIASPLFLFWMGSGNILAQENIQKEHNEWLGVILKYNLSGSIGIYTSQYLIFKDKFRERGLRSEFGMLVKPFSTLTFSGSYYTLPNPDEFDRTTLTFAVNFKPDLNSTKFTLQNKIRYDHSSKLNSVTKDYVDFLRNKFSLRYNFSKKMYGEVSIEPFLEFGNIESRISRYESTGAFQYNFGKNLWLRPYYRYRKVNGTVNFSDYHQLGFQVGVPLINPKNKSSKTGIEIEIRLHAFYLTKIQ